MVLGLIPGPDSIAFLKAMRTPENVLSAIPSNSTTAAGLADTKAYIAAMKAAGMGTANQIDSAVVTVGSNGSFNVLPHVGS